MKFDKELIFNTSSIISHNWFIQNTSYSPKNPLLLLLKQVPGGMKLTISRFFRFEEAAILRKTVCGAVLRVMKIFHAKRGKWVDGGTFRTIDPFYKREVGNDINRICHSIFILISPSFALRKMESTSDLVFICMRFILWFLRRY